MDEQPVPGAMDEPVADPTSVEAAETATPTAAPAAAPGRSRPRWLRRPRLPRSRRGILALLLIVGAFVLVFTAGAIQVITWTETADFCGRCHTMGPELAAHEAGPHRDVTCGECHVEPGVDGWVKAKINGSRQLLEIVLGTFPEPIPPPEHDALPDAADTCQRCHDIDRVKPAGVVTRVQYTPDEINSRQFVGLLIRPGDGDIMSHDRTVHWHVLEDVRFGTALANSQVIDWVEATGDDGEVRTFIALDEVADVTNAGPDLERLQAADQERRMDCLDCHNRVGHPIESPRRALDDAMFDGRVDRTLPYMKREGMRVLYSPYRTLDEADASIEELRDFYESRYPETAKYKAGEIERAVEELQLIYRLVATPTMQVTAVTYPDNLGHTDFIGCFRCHDGTHYLVENGALTNEVIPSSCDTCHTFPQIGAAVASLPLGIPPDTHDDTLWVFNHRLVAPDEDPGRNECGECHARDYCVNCHQTGAVDVEHDEMAFNHAESIRKAGSEACAYCHQPVYCALCHTEDVLPGTLPGNTGALIRPPADAAWPLRIVTSVP